MLYSKDNVKFVSAEGAGGIGKGEGSFSSLCSVLFYLLLVQSPLAEV